MKRFLFLTILSLVFAFTTASSTHAQEPLPRFETSKCPLQVPHQASIVCGTFVAPEDYDNPQGKTIRMPVIIIHSRDGNPSNEALFFTEGGPGYSSLGSVRWLAGSGFGDHRDIVILEQRGNKFADPSLACDFSIWWDEKQGHTPCLDGLRQQGIALENYTASSIAEDINALKQVLKYDTWLLYGTSYSTRLMQLAMARYPENIRAVVLQSTSPVTDNRYLHDPEHSARALQVMFTDCAADPACSNAYPDLEREIYDLVSKLNDQPLDFEIPFAQSGTQVEIEVSGETLISYVDGHAFYGPAYQASETAHLPLLIDQVAKGNTDLLYPWAKNYVSRWGDDSFAWGLYFAINCQDDAPSVTPEMVDAQMAAFPELDGYYRHRTELAICTAWGLEPSSSLPIEPVTSDIPVLVLGGRYDPITPPEWSRTALTNLGQSTFVEFPASGHNVLNNNPCAQQIIAAFFDDPSKAPDLACMDSMPAAKFVLPNEIILAPAIYEIHDAELGYSMLEENLFLVSWLTLMGTGLIALIAGVVTLARPSNQTCSDIAARITQPLLIVLAVSVLFWGLALRSTLRSIAATSATVLRFGLPLGYWWLFAIVLLIGLITIILMVITALAWKRSYWSLPGRLALSLTTLAAILFCGLLANWGLFNALF
jgi:pimeloyl-ACP methyl ester carboxylesterase